MSGYLDEYGVADAKKEKRIKTLVLTVVGVAITCGVLWYLLRDYKEESRVKEFVALLERQDYKPAYAMWGCTDEKPCRDYSFNRFMEDWGLETGTLQIGKKKSCDGGIIQTMQVKGQEVNLYVDRATLSVGFAPWPVCSPRIKL